MAMDDSERPGMAMDDSQKIQKHFLNIFCSYLFTLKIGLG